MRDEINGQRENDGGVLFSADAGQRLEVAQLEGMATLVGMTRCRRSGPWDVTLSKAKLPEGPRDSLE